MKTSTSAYGLSVFATTLFVIACGQTREKEERDESASSRPESSPEVSGQKTACQPELAPSPPSGEGMWPWNDLGGLDESALQKRGLELPLSEIWTPGKGGLARAAVGLGGCTASFVSERGLLLTNHHCVFRAIQRNSTPENNLLRNGFLARKQEEELDGYGIKVLVFMGQRDVTELILGEIERGGIKTDLERMTRIEEREKELVKECEKKPNTRCRVVRNNDGLSFELLEKSELKDVRLVAAPPRSLGEFGGETDNWQWPRHSMDFALIRAYVSPDGEPAEYDLGNVPFRPERHFQVSPSGVEQGDLVMVVGTPYRTSRYRSAYAVRQALEWYYPLRVSLFAEWIDRLEQTCKEVPDSCLPTASTVKMINNGLTNARGMITGLKRARVVERKQSDEAQWREWIDEDEKRKDRFGSALDDLVSGLESAREGRDRDLIIRYMLLGRAAHLLGFARTITKWADEQQKPDSEREAGFQERDRKEIVSRLKQAQRSLHVEADKRILAMFLDRMGALQEGERLRAIDDALGSNWSEASIDQYLETLYRGTRIGEAETRAKLFDVPLSDLRASEDRMIRLALELMPELDAWDDRNKALEGMMSRLRPVYIESLVNMKGNRFYPDANASPRISFATVSGYCPRDGVWHTPFTTLGGLMAKHTGKKPFNAPLNVMSLIEARAFGQYADPIRKNVTVCFLSNADTTGGNSGSPAVDGKGRLAGLNFDRVYENIAGDYGYNTALSRNIMVDVRGILWYLDRVLGANHLLAELGVK